MNEIFIDPFILHSNENDILSIPYTALVYSIDAEVCEMCSTIITIVLNK